MSSPDQIFEEREPTPEPPKKSSKKTKRRGPPIGVFIDEGDKAAGILDSTGSIILMTNPHLLGEAFARRQAASQTSSPDLGFAEILDESDAPESSYPVSGISPDIMIASLNAAADNASRPGQAIGPADAIFTADTSLLQEIRQAMLEEGPGEDEVNLEDVIQFESDSEGSDGVTSPIYVPPEDELRLPNITGGNVTSFRNSAAPAYAAMVNHANIADPLLPSSPLATPAPTRRRKNKASPYSSSHYKGVTPVQRKLDPNNGHFTPDGLPPQKRRKLTN
jgi:hypothetical protein